MHGNKVSIEKNRKIHVTFSLFSMLILFISSAKVRFEGDLLFEKVEFFLSIDVFYFHKHQKNMHFLSGKWSARSVQEKHHPSEFSARHVIRGGLEIIGKK